MTQGEFFAINLVSLTAGTTFAYLIEKLKRENELMNHSAMTTADRTAQADSRLNHVLKNRFLVVDHCLAMTIRGLDAQSNVSGAASSSEVTALLVSAQESLHSCTRWVHQREFFLQLAHKRYQTCLRLVSVHEALRRCAGPSVALRIECPPSLCVDEVVLSLCLEEALSNARKYGDMAKAIVIWAVLEDTNTTSGSGGGEARGGGSDNVGGSSTGHGGSESSDSLRLQTTIDTINPSGAKRLSAEDACRAFDEGYKGSASLSSSLNTRSDGIGLAAARSAACAAGGTVELLTEEDDAGNVHTLFRLRLPAKLGTPLRNQPSQATTSAACSTTSAIASTVAATAVMGGVSGWPAGGACLEESPADITTDLDGAIGRQSVDKSCNLWQRTERHTPAVRRTAAAANRWTPQVVAQR